MANLLKSLQKENNELQASTGDINDCTVDKLLTEMDASRMGAVDREVARRDLIAMVQEREGLGIPIPMELDDESKEMCKHIVSNIGFCSRLEIQLYVVLCIATFFILSDILLGVKLLGGASIENLMNQSENMDWRIVWGSFLNVIWYYVVYLSYRQKSLFKKKGKGSSPLMAIGSLILATVGLSNLAMLCYPIVIMFFSRTAIYIGRIIDLVIFAAAKYSYDKYINEQCKEYRIGLL